MSNQSGTASSASDGESLLKELEEKIKALENRAKVLRADVAKKQDTIQELLTLQEWIAGSDLDYESDEDECVEELSNGDAVDFDSTVGKKPPISKKFKSPLPHFYDWRIVFPEVRSIVENYKLILAEASNMEKQLRYCPWPESNLYNRNDQTGDWKVVPLLYTFPAYDESSATWVESNCVQCPETVKLLKGIKGIRTALFSRMGAMTRLSAHRGWADLSNHVLRCHLTLRLPADKENPCGIWVEGQIVHHRLGDVIVFDDSHEHKAFNASEQFDRVVLIFDILRPPGMPLGVAVGEHTDQLDE